MATIVLSAKKVIAACELIILSILEKQKAENASIIVQYIKYHTPNSFWAKFGFKPPTEEQAITKLTEDIWLYTSATYEHQLQHARKLLKLAQNGNPVTLNEEDVGVIF